MYVIAILLSMGLIIAAYYYWIFTYWAKKGVKNLRPTLFFGNLAGVIFRKTPVYHMFLEAYETCKKSGDKYIGYYFLNNPTLVVCDIELVKNILAKDFIYFTDRHFYINENDPLTVNIASTKGDQWKKMREQLTPAFSPSKLKIMCDTLLKAREQLVSALDELEATKEAVNIKDVTGKYIVDAIGMSIFGIECNTLQGANIEFKKFAEKILGGDFIQNIKLVLCNLAPMILLLFRINFYSVNIQKFYLELVKNTVEYREKNNVVRKDLMHSIIQLRNNVSIDQEKNNLTLSNVPESEKTLNFEEITAQAIIFFGAAYETTTSAISVCVYELALNIDIQNNLREEILNVLKKYNGKVCYEAIMEMTYLDKCISETLRKYPVCIGSRICTKTYKIPNSDLVLEKGSTVYIPNYQIHHDPEYYPDPQKFDPERFSPENKAKRPGFTFLSLGEGQRNCIGGRLAVLKFKIFISTLLANYTFTINPKSQLPSHGSPLSKTCFIVSLDKPLYINLEKI